VAESVSPAVVSAMERLYAVEPDEFMGERRRLAGEAKAAGDKTAYAEIGKLRKPSLAGWAVNLVAREAPDELAILLGVGEKLRDAQSRLDMATLQALRPARDSAVDGFVAAAVRVLAGRDRDLKGAAQQEVRDTAIAAIADAGAARVVTSGQLVKALSYSGFGEVDVSDAVARTSSGAILTVLEGRDAGSGSETPDVEGSVTSETSGTSAATQASPAADAAKAAERAAKARLDAEQAAAARAERLARAEGSLADAEQSLADAEAAMTQARRTLKAAERARDSAVKELAAARHA